MGRSGYTNTYKLGENTFIKLIKKYNPKVNLNVSVNDNRYCDCDSDTEYEVEIKFDIDRDDAKEIMNSYVEVITT
jgi:preprotein translocase subunit SecB